LEQDRVLLRLAVAPHDGAQHFPCLRKAAGSLPIFADALRPLRALEDFGIGFRHHPGIDQRAAAQSVGDQRADVGPDTNVEQALALAARAGSALGAEAHVAGEVGHARRKHARQVLLAALEHADADLPAITVRAPGELRRSDGASVSAADDDDVKVGAFAHGSRSALGDEFLEPPGDPGRCAGFRRVVVRFRGCVVVHRHSLGR